MTLPKSVTVLGTRWPILHRDIPLEDNGETIIYGLTDCDAFTISINTATPAPMVPEILLHEIMHAIEAMLRRDIGEDCVQHFAQALRSVFVGNPEVTKCVTS